MFRRQLYLGAALLLGALIAACGGGGGGGSTPPVIPNAGGSTLSKSTGATIRVTIPKSNGATSSSVRRPAFISSNTASITIGIYSVNGASPAPSPEPTPVSVTIATSPDCTTTASGTSCTITVTVPIATSVVLQLSTFDASGTLLGTAQIGPINTTLTTIPAQTVSVGGVPATLTISPSSLSANDDGQTHQISFSVTAIDASGNTIVQPGPYANPIVLSIAGDTNGALSLSTTSIASPGPNNGATTVTLSYNSLKPITTATITATYGSTKASTLFDPITNATGGGTLVGAPKIYKYNPAGGAANYGITVGPDGQTLWFLDRANFSLGSITSPASCNASCATIAEQQPFPTFSSPPTQLALGLQGITAASDGGLYVTDFGGGSDLGDAYQISCSGTSCNPATDLNLGNYLVTPAPGPVLSAPDGNIYIGSQFSNAFASSTILSAIAVGCCSSGFASINVTNGGPSSIDGMTVDASGQTLWFTDSSSGNVGYFSIPCNGCTPIELPSGLSPPPSCQCAAVHHYHGGVQMAQRQTIPPRKRPKVVVCCGSPFSALNGIVSAPDGNLYVAETGANQIDQLNPSTWRSCIGTSCVFTPIPLPISGGSPMNLVVGGDGNVWFTDTTGYVGFISLRACAAGTCKITEYSVGGSPWGITAGPDGDIWFTLSSPDSNGNTLGKVVLQ